ncbi:hypothetical protein VHUM_00608 [Vanrija humicola]|uniref:Uncharacterized protein n=1 Tax=Vanrija humicola TaxID=5417 RepID=A0A7D8V8E6_VANHU|nr:hypothetical protein VHUM_00608 [Vanrija humicola]
MAAKHNPQQAGELAWLECGEWEAATWPPSPRPHPIRTQANTPSRRPHLAAPGHLLDRPPALHLRLLCLLRPRQRDASRPRVVEPPQVRQRVDKLPVGHVLPRHGPRALLDHLHAACCYLPLGARPHDPHAHLLHGRRVVRHGRGYPDRHALRPRPAVQEPRLELPAQLPAVCRRLPPRDGHRRPLVGHVRARRRRLLLHAPGQVLVRVQAQQRVHRVRAPRARQERGGLRTARGESIGGWGAGAGRTPPGGGGDMAGAGQRASSGVAHPLQTAPTVTTHL